jgi:hypothetical protein
MNLQLASFSSLLQPTHTFMQRFMALAGLLVPLVSAKANSQRPRKLLFAFNGKRCDLCR